MFKVIYMATVKLHVEDRRCISYVKEIESECHVLLHCPLYADIRGTFSPSRKLLGIGHHKLYDLGKFQ